jgi:hypothetical protein
VVKSTNFEAKGLVNPQDLPDLIKPGRRDIDSHLN